MRNRFDWMAKQIGQEALRLLGTTIANGEITPETRYGDLCHEPDPARQAEREQLGLLGRLAGVPCLIEVYSEAPSAEEFRACLGKHIALWQQRARKARSDQRKRGDLEPPEAIIDPYLWIIAAGAPITILTGLQLVPATDWPRGVYLFGNDILRVGIVVASELPRDRKTLLIRIMAGGPLLAPAVKELAALPPDACERVVAEPILLQLQHVLAQDPSPTPEEKEFIMAMHKTWEEGRAEAREEGRAEAREEGRAEARAEKGASDLLVVLRIRGIAVPEAVRERILVEKDLQRLERWLERAIVATSIEQVLDELS
jgi:hypothetical protein